MEPKTENWLCIAKDDYDVATQLFESKKYLYCLFFCQQAIEKAFKALYYEKYNKTPPRKHNLTSLAADAGIIDEVDDRTFDLLDTLSQFYIETRYSDDRNSLARKCNRTFTKSIFNQTGGVLEWLKSKLR